MSKNVRETGNVHGDADSPERPQTMQQPTLSFFSELLPLSHFKGVRCDLDIQVTGAHTPSGYTVTVTLTPIM
jgi:hypothetical protein